MNTTVHLDLDSLVKTKLPPMPGSALKITSLLQDVNVSQKKIAEAVGCDPMLSVRILRLANSPIYSFQKQITTVSNAVMAVGNRAIYEMVLIGMTTNSFAREIHGSEIGRDIWSHSLAVAFAARQIGQTLKIRGVEEAFTCGLLHDIGSLILFRKDPGVYTEIYHESDDDDLSEIEAEVFGFDHAQVGAVVAHKWDLPMPVCNLILSHHQPSQAEQGLFMAYVINAADELAHWKKRGLPIDLEILNSPSMTALCLNAQQLEDIWEKASGGIEEISRTFN